MEVLLEFNITKGTIYGQPDIKSANISLKGELHIQ